MAKGIGDRGTCEVGVLHPVVDRNLHLDTVTTDNSLLLLREMERIEPRLRVVWAPENQCVVDAYVRGLS